MIGNNIRTRREKLRICPKDFANRLDIDLSYLNRIENSKVKRFEPEFILQIAIELDTTVAELFYQTTNSVVQQNEQGQNSDVLNEQPKLEKVEETIWQKVVAAKEETNRV